VEEEDRRRIGDDLRGEDGARDRGEDDIGGRDGEVGPVVLANADEIEPQLVREQRLRERGYTSRRAIRMIRIAPIAA